MRGDRSRTRLADARNTVWLALADAHRRARQEFAPNAPGLALMGAAELELSRRLEELAIARGDDGKPWGLDGAVKVLLDVVRVLEASAREKRDLGELRPNMAFSPKVVEWAMGKTSGPVLAADQLGAMFGDDEDAA